MTPEVFKLEGTVHFTWGRTREHISHAMGPTTFSYHSCLPPDSKSSKAQSIDGLQKQIVQYNRQELSVMSVSGSGWKRLRWQGCVTSALELAGRV